MLHTDDNTEAFRAMTERVHQAGCPIIAQLAHCGRNGVMGRKGRVEVLSDEVIRKVIDDFLNAGIRAQKAGFDGIEIHCAHGYLLSEFLSPKTNRRKDRWGGTIENRFLIVSEILRKLKTAMPEFPVFVKINGQERVGIQIADACRNAVLCEKSGADAIEVSCALNNDFFMSARGDVPYDMICHDYPLVKNLPKPVKAILKPVLVPKLRSPQPMRKYNVQTALAVKHKVSIPIIVVGGIHDLAEIREVLSTGLDAVSICRPLILEPSLIRNYRQERQTEAKCIHCNHCLIGITQRPLQCYYGKVPGNK